MKPTDEQIREFWEWCGCKIKATKLNGSPAWSVYFPDNRCETNYLGDESRSLTLDNLFKYAVPKLGGRYDIRIQNCLEGWYVLISQPYGGEFEPIRDKDLALALFWAIYEVIKEV